MAPLASWQFKLVAFDLRRAPQPRRQPSGQFAKQFRLRRVRMNRIADLRERHARAHHHHRFTDQRVRMIGEEVHADDALRRFIRDQLRACLNVAYLQGLVLNKSIATSSMRAAELVVIGEPSSSCRGTLIAGLR